MLLCTIQCYSYTVEVTWLSWKQASFQSSLDESRDAQGKGGLLFIPNSVSVVPETVGWEADSRPEGSPRAGKWGRGCLGGREALGGLGQGCTRLPGPSLSLRHFLLTQ